MADEKKRNDQGETTPHAKRTGREGNDPTSQPGEFADEMRTNRSTPPPDPPIRKKK